MLITFLNILFAGVLMGGIYALISIGLNIQWGVTRVLNMAYGEFIMLAGFGTYFGYTVFGINPLVSLVIFGPAMLGIGTLLYKFLFQRLFKSSESVEMFEISALLAAYGIMYIISNVAKVMWGAELKAYSYLSQPIKVFGTLLATNRLVALAFAIGFSVGIYILLNRTRLGKAIRATTLDFDAARLMGINVHQVLGISFGIGTMLAGTAGTLLSVMFPVSPFMGLKYLIIAFIVIIMGGMGNILGSLAGGLILGIVGSVVQYYDSGLSMVAFYAIFAIILLAKPTGIFGKKS